MSKEAQSHELTYDLIKRAVHGDQEAIEAYLLHYDSYINSLVMYDEVGPDGQLHSYIDEDMKIQATSPTSSAGAHTHSLTPKGKNANTGGGGSHTNLQPYIVCYMWKRTA